MAKKTFEEVLIKTPIDKLIELIKEYKEISLDFAASKIGEDVSTVEEWASVLEEQGIIKIDYKLSKVILKWNAPSKQEFIERKADVEQTKNEISDKVDKLLEKVYLEKSGMDAILKSLNNFYSQYGEKVKLLEMLANEIKNTKSASEDDYNKLSKSIEKLNIKIESFNDRISLLQNNLIQMKDRLESFNIDKNIKKVEKAKQEITRIYEHIKEMREEINNAKERLLNLSSEFSDLRELAKKFKEIETSISKFEEKMESLDKKFESLEEFKNSVNNIRGFINKTEIDIDKLEEKLKNPSGTINQIKKEIKQIEQKKKEILDALNVAKETAETAKDQLKTLLPNVPTIEEFNKIKKEIGELKENISDWNKTAESIEKLKDIDRIFDDLVKLTKKIDEEKLSLSTESGKIIKKVEEEREVFSAIEKLKERTFLNLNNYNIELEELKKEFEEINNESKKITSKVEKSLEKIEARNPSEIKEIIDALNIVINKGKDLEKISKDASILSKQLQVLNENLELLKKEIKVLELRNPEEIGKKIGLAEEEINDYAEKKKKLTNYLKKLLSEDNKKEDS